MMTVNNTITDVMSTMLEGEDLTSKIVEECRNNATRIGRMYGQWFDVSELASFLETEIWLEMREKDKEFHDIRMIRRLIKLRTVDYIREQVRFGNQQPRSWSLHREDVENSHIWSLEETTPSSHIELSEQFVLSKDLKEFRKTLTARQNQILDLVSDGYGNSEICEMLNVSINTPNNSMKKIRQLALDYGL